MGTRILIVLQSYQASQIQYSKDMPMRENKGLNTRTKKNKSND